MSGETPLPAARYEDTVEWAVWMLCEQVSAEGPLAPQAIELIAKSDRAFLRLFFGHLSHHIHAIRGAIEELDLDSVKRMFVVNVNGIIRMISYPTLRRSCRLPAHEPQVRRP